MKQKSMTLLSLNLVMINTANSTTNNNTAINTSINMASSVNNGLHLQSPDLSTPPHIKRVSSSPPKMKRQNTFCHRAELSEISEDPMRILSRPPLMITPDMPFGLESISCELACYFYMKYRNKLIYMDSRRDVKILYMKTFKSWCPVHLVNAPRHVSQVMFAMAYYVCACRVFGGKIKWNNLIQSPSPPCGYPNQFDLIKNVTMRY